MRTIFLLCLGVLGACSQEKLGTPPGLLRSFGLRELQDERRVALLPEKPAREFTGEINIKNTLDPEHAPVVVKVSWGVAEMTTTKMEPKELVEKNLVWASIFNKNRIVSLRYELSQSQPGMLYKDSGFSMDNLGEIQYLRGEVCFNEEKSALTSTSQGIMCKNFYVLACGSIVDEDALTKKSGHIEVTESPCKLEFKDTPPSSNHSPPASTPSGTQPSTSPAPH